MANRIEEMVLDFRKWIQDFNQLPQQVVNTWEAIDLATLVGHFIALRQDIQLQTKSTRTVIEQNSELVKQLSKAASEYGKSPIHRGDEEIKPLLKVILDTYDALVLSQRQVEKGRRSLERLIDQIEVENPSIVLPPGSEIGPKTEQSVGFWGRIFGYRKLSNQKALDEEGHPLEKWRKEQLQNWSEKQEQNRQVLELIQQTVDGLLTGYSMSLIRMEKVFPQFELEPIRVLGERFDPELMEVLEVVCNSEKATGIVIEEVRRGYLFRGTIFRYAQVRVAK